MASIRSRGIKQPLTVRWDEPSQVYRVIDGGRRHAAALKLGLAELPCWVQRADGQDLLVDQIVHNWQRAELKPLETAAALARLRDEHGMTQQQIVEATGKPKGEISKFLAIHDRVAPSVKKLAEANGNGKPSLSKRHLYNLSKLEASKQLALADDVKEMTAIEAENFVRTFTSPKDTSVVKRGGLAARQLRISTAKAELLFTFRNRGYTSRDVLECLQEAATHCDAAPRFVDS